MTWTGLRSACRLWLILLPLIAVVLVPTVCVLWFANRAMRNERVAVQQRLTDAYRAQLTGVQQRIDAYWRDKIDALQANQDESLADLIFARLVKSGRFDSVIILDAGGQVRYPAPAGSHPTGPTESVVWAEASTAEHETGDLKAALSLYEGIARVAPEAEERARALVAQARCLVKKGDRRAAIDVLAKTLADTEYRDTADERGLLIVPNAHLMALRLIEDKTATEYREVLDRLVERLNDYGEPLMPSTQRVHLMNEVRSIAPQASVFLTLEAEQLALAYLEADPSPLNAGKLSTSSLPNVWRLPSANGQVIALLGEDRVTREIQKVAGSAVAFSGARLRCIPPGQAKPAALLTGTTSEVSPDWMLALQLDGSAPLDSLVNRQVAAYLWTGVLAILLIALFAVLVVRQVRRQARLAELQNNLVATVSHELKTPLSSIRLLLEVLAENECQDRNQVKDYVGLITRETTRLDRLIEHFLAYSRLEQKRHTFIMDEVEPARIARSAVEFVRDRYAGAGADLTVDVPPDLPVIRGDAESLVTVLVNLLDNAFKYCDNRAQVLLRAQTANGQVYFIVQDNGIGLSRRSIKRIFDRFYQVDQRLSRKTGGCGLGLSIIRFIVHAHGGSVQVASELGKGSTFMVRLPVLRQG